MAYVVILVVNIDFENGFCRLGVLRYLVAG